MARLTIWVALLSLFASLTWCATMRLPSFPLAVKTPYLSVWMPGHLSHDFPSATPQFWQGTELTWIILARLNGTSYCLLGCTGGRPGTTQAIQKSLNFSSTHTYVTFQAGSAELTLDFFSAVDPIDHVRQSLPYTYVTITASHNETNAPALDVMTAIDASWLSTRGEPFASFYTADGSKIVALNGKQEVEFGENRNMALWGDVVLGSQADSESSLSSCQVGSPQSIFQAFVELGSLTEFIGTMEYDNIAACSQRIRPEVHHHSNHSSATFVIGMHQDKAIQYNDGNSTLPQAAYFRSKASNVSEAVAYLFDDFEAASNQSQHFDEHIRSIGMVTSSNYSDLLEFAVRQCYGGMQVTIPYDTLDTSDPYAFIKEISTDGNVNTLADLIPKALPIFHILNPEYTRMFLEPVLRFSKEAWPLNHAIHDIGKSYPNATGETPCKEEFLPLDSTSVLLWMLHLYQNTTGNTDLTEDYSKILQTYADYCLRYGLFPVLQRSSVDALGSAPNQTALSVSAAIALNAYGEMTGQKNYSEAGISMAEAILHLGRDANSTHFLTHYTDEDEAWILMYPLAFDAWLGLETFPKSIHKAESDWYYEHRLPYGLQYRNNLRYTLMEWQMWVAAISSTALRDHLVNAVHRFLNRDTSARESAPGPTQWVVVPGDDEGRWTLFSRAKSNIGSLYMIAAVQGGFNTTYASIAPRSSRSKRQSGASWQGLVVQGANAADVDQHFHQPDVIVSQYDIPYEVPEGASKWVDSSFLGLSFDTASFPKFLGGQYTLFLDLPLLTASTGNSSTPNKASQNLIHNLIVASDSTLTIRMGGPEGDYSVFDPIQSTPIESVDISRTTTLSIGPPFFDSIKALDPYPRIDWIYQVPFASNNVYSSVQGAAAAVDAIPRGQLYALEIGHKTNLYAGKVRSDNYTCREYAAELFLLESALKQAIGPVQNQFQALGFAHDAIDDAWSMEECFTNGIKAQDNLRTVSIHYSQVDSHEELYISSLPRHSAIKREFERILPEANYMDRIYPCHPLVVSEASLVSTAANDYDSAWATFEHNNTFDVGLWNLDFLLYAMSQNVSKVLMHQACDSPSSAWIPGSCKTASDNSTEVGGAYYALTFVAAFVSGARKFQVVPVHESEDSVVYAGYESGKLAKIAVVNYTPASDSKLASGPNTLDLRVPPEVMFLEQNIRMTASDLDSDVMRFSERTWNRIPNWGQRPFAQDTLGAFIVVNETLSISVDAGVALLLDVFA